MIIIEYGLKKLATIKVRRTYERTVGSDAAPASLQRYIYSNHLQTASLELDENADIVSYEEYHPFGTTAYQASNSAINALAKRYRYTGKERDEETGLYYHGARYYIPWLAVWTAIDPMEADYAGMSPYNYAFNNPVMLNDPSGADPQTSQGPNSNIPQNNSGVVGSGDGWRAHGDGTFKIDLGMFHNGNKSSGGNGGGSGGGSGNKKAPDKKKAAPAPPSSPGGGNGGSGGGGGSQGGTGTQKKSGGWYETPNHKMKFFEGDTRGYDFTKSGIKGKYVGQLFDAINGLEYKSDGTIVKTNATPTEIKANPVTVKVDTVAKNTVPSPINSQAQSGGGGNLDNVIKTTGVVNDALGAAYSTTEAIAGGGIILTNKLSKASNVMYGVKIIKNVPAIGVVGFASDAIDVGLDAYNGDYGKAVLKGGILILKNGIRFSSPIGFAVITLIDLGVSAYDLYNDVKK